LSIAKRVINVDRQAFRDSARLAVFERSLNAQEPLLDEILGFADAAEYAVGDPEGAATQLLHSPQERHGLAECWDHALGARAPSGNARARSQGCAV
jgi:hypothetical protein